MKNTITHWGATTDRKQKTWNSNARILERFDLNPTHSVFRVRPDFWEVPDFLPGQIVNLGIEIKRTDNKTRPFRVCPQSR